MRFFATTARGSSVGDFFGLYFGACGTEGETDELGGPDEEKGPFLEISRQFEFPDWGKCSLYSSEEELRGEYRVNLLAFSPSGIGLEVLADRAMHVEISFELSLVEFRSLKRFVDVVLDNAEPFDDDP